MSAPTLTFFNNKGGVWKTSLVYHVAWMLSELDHVVLAVDLDPQANSNGSFPKRRRSLPPVEGIGSGRNNYPSLCRAADPGR